MTDRYRPVLTIPDPVEAFDWFGSVAGFSTDPAGREVSIGHLGILILRPDEGPAGMRDIPFDHLALRVDDVDATLSRLVARGARLDPAYTPDGPREISVFWDVGVRFAFVIGPGGLPIEICARRVPKSSADMITGLDHLGLRRRDLARAADDLIGQGAVELARYRLPGPVRPVDVRFLQEANLCWEVFDEDAPALPGHVDPVARWSGVAKA
jgi:catechol 2,3-dioxygenase-like lactoylglutathione lyase family enzyme